MINKERYSFIFLAILAMLDQLIASLFGVDFTYSSLSLVSHLCFCGCLLVVFHERSLNRFLYACLCGLCVGMFFTSDWLGYWLFSRSDGSRSLGTIRYCIPNDVCEWFNLFFWRKDLRISHNELCEMVYSHWSFDFDF